jgi:hypothetical protein
VQRRYGLRQNVKQRIPGLVALGDQRFFHPIDPPQQVVTCFHPQIVR